MPHSCSVSWCVQMSWVCSLFHRTLHWGVWEAAELWQVLVDRLVQCLLTVLCSCQASLWQTMEVPSGSWQEGCRWAHLWGEKEAAEGTVTATRPFQAAFHGCPYSLTWSPASFSNCRELLPLVLLLFWLLIGCSSCCKALSPGQAGCASTVQIGEKE